MYDLKVCWLDHDERKTKQHPAWKNLSEYAYNRADAVEFSDAIIFINKELEKFNCVNILRSDYIRFETESDAMQFILTWI
jgi:hypothetical protein